MTEAEKAEVVEKDPRTNFKKGGIFPVVVDYNLHNQESPGMVIARGGVGIGLLLCELPLGSSGGYFLPTKKPDQSSFSYVVFDGTLLPSELPESGKILGRHYLGEALCSPETFLSVYPDPKIAPLYKRAADGVRVEIFRYFMLLPECNLTMCKYVGEDSHPTTVTVKVFQKKGTRTIEWWEGGKQICLSK